MKLTKGLTLMLWVGFIIMLPLSTHAEEDASGHYTPGAAASFIDRLPGKPGLALANFFNYYDGNASATKQLPYGGLIAGNLDATSYADTVVVLYQTPLKLLGGDYAVGLAIPYVWLEVKGDVRITVVDPLKFNLIFRRRSFAEENNVWVRRVMRSILCNYREDMTFPADDISFYVPQKGERACPQLK